jgi:hypothetical protein
MVAQQPRRQATIESCVVARRVRDIQRREEVDTFTRLRQWVNRDDGRICRLHNRPLGALETVGLLMFMAALILWQLHVKAGIGSTWAYSSGVLGVVLATVGAVTNTNR